MQCEHSAACRRPSAGLDVRDTGLAVVRVGLHGGRPLLEVGREEEGGGRRLYT